MIEQQANPAAGQPMNQDKYCLQPHPTPISQELAEMLKQQAKNFQQAFKEHKQRQFFDRDVYYILSKKWFDRWKVYVGYDQIANGQATNKFFGSGIMPDINQDIIDEKAEFSVTFVGKLSFYNVALKPGLQQQKDYIFCSEEMWDVFGQYSGQAIKRLVQETIDGKKVQLYFKKLNLLIVFNDFLKDVQREKVTKFIQVVCQVSHYSKVQQITDSLGEKLRQRIAAEHFYGVSFNKPIPIRLWLCPQDTRKNILLNTFLQGCKANPSFSYKLYLDAELLQNQRSINDFDIMEDSVVIAQMKQSKQQWCFFNMKNLLKGACNSCRQILELKYMCSCKFAAYCSKDCKSKDKSHHKFRCPTQAESDQEEAELAQNENSRKGVVGLRNLGNTCFMNSGLQCCSHAFQLSRYFLSGKYLQEINKDNPLGTQGQLSTHYGKMIKNLWYGSESSFSPTQFKRAIGKYQPMFSGYNQHDSGQLINFLLDGLHEDLNRIKKKPYVQTKDYDGRPDPVIAKQSWENFLARNQSIIVDLMYGQYRSVVDCPNCQYTSIQFDPFLMCQLPITHTNNKKIELKFVKDHFYTQKLTIVFQTSWKWTMKDVMKQVAKKMGLSDQARLYSYVASYASCQQVTQGRSADEVRKQYKYRTIYIRQLIQGENPDKDLKVVLGNTACHSYYNDESYRKSLISYRLYFISKDLSCKEVHHKLYGYYKKAMPFQNYQEQVINVEEKQQPMRILMVPASRYSTCDFCKKKSCDGCPLVYDDRKFGEVVPDELDKIEMELYWRKKQKDIQKIFDDPKFNLEEQQGGTQQLKQKAQTSLTDCFKLFSEPEKLNQQNAWYCPRCKDFVLATKQMQIYKAPKILILCLKRFKRKQYFQQKFNILVDFPINDLDISDYVLNTDLPQQYFVQKMQIDGQEKKKVHYDLFGVVNHFGGTGGGHYTAYAKNPYNKQWHDFDDSYVTKVKSENDIVSQSAYILFYKRREN